MTDDGTAAPGDGLATGYLGLRRRGRGSIGGCDGEAAGPVDLRGVGRRELVEVDLRVGVDVGTLVGNAVV